MSAILVAGFVTMLSAAESTSVPRIDLLPDLPRDLSMRNWRRVALDFDRLAFDEKAAGPYLPLIWREPGPAFGLPSYVGHPNQGVRGGHEAITTLAALWGATLVGIDKRAWLPMAEAYLNPKQGVVLNGIGASTGQSFWYELVPGMIFTALADRYPSWQKGRTIADRMARQWAKVAESIDTFDHTSFDLAADRPVDNGQWKEPDAAAGIAWLQAMAYLRTRDPIHLRAYDRCVRWLSERRDNPDYEIMLPYGAYAVARMNAELGRSDDVAKLLNWSLDPAGAARFGWGMIVGQWGGHDVGGLIGSTTDGGGYAFAMNTFATAGALTPLARYDDRLSEPIAKWLLNAASAARLFYRNGLPPEHQSGWEWKGDPRACVAYEGLRREWKGVAPKAMGDPTVNGWAKTDFGLYGSGWVGVLGAVVHPSNIAAIPWFDLNAVDVARSKAFPTYLARNPLTSVREVILDVGSRPVRLYDAVANRFLSGVHRKRAVIRLQAKQTVQIVVVPAAARVASRQGRLTADGVVIDYRPPSGKAGKY